MESSDMLALANNIKDNDGWGNGNSWWFILILFFLIGGNGWGWNRGGDCASKADLYESANAQNTFSEFRSLQNETTRGFSDVNQHLCNGFANINQNVSGNFANTNMGIAKGFYDNALAMNCGFNTVNQGICASNSAIQAAIADTNYRMQNCCCDIEKKIADDGEKTRALIQGNEIQRLRDALQDEKNERLATGLTTANIIQTNSLEAYMRQLLNYNNNSNFYGCGC